MKEFLLILLFSKTILLTPQPININGNYEIFLEKPISAITTGAYLYIDVSKHISREDDEGIIEFRERVSKKFPEKMITAFLLCKGNSNSEVKLVYTGCAFNRKEVFLSLTSINEVPTGVGFEKVIIKSEIDLQQVSIYWRNFKK